MYNKLMCKNLIRASFVLIFVLIFPNFTLAKKLEYKQNHYHENKLSEEDCLATAIYYESRNENLLGQAAVGRVVLNRVKKGFKSTICKVVSEKNQFHFKNTSNKNSKQWNNSIKLAHQLIYEDAFSNLVPTALFFKNNHCKTIWKKYILVAHIGHQFFFTWRHYE